MTLDTTISRSATAGNGSTTAFSFPYFFIANADLVVILRNDTTGVEVVQTITTHYTVAGAGVGAGGTVTMVTAPSSGETLIIYRDPAITQGLDLEENDGMPAESNEEAHDKAAMIAQRNEDRLSRAMALSEGFNATFDPKLPNLLTALYLLQINAAGNGFDQVSTSTIFTQLTAAVTTKGDLYGFSTVGARVPVGSYGQGLFADSGEALGIKWGSSRRAGVVTLADTNVSKAIVFGTNMPDANYSAFISFLNTVDGAPIVPGYWVSAKANTGFTIKFTDAIIGSNFSMLWKVEEHES